MSDDKAKDTTEKAATEVEASKYPTILNVSIEEEMPPLEN